MITIPPTNEQPWIAQSFREVQSALAGPLTTTSGFPLTGGNLLSGEATGKHLSTGYDIASSTGYIRAVDAGNEFSNLHVMGKNVSLWAANGADPAAEILRVSRGDFITTYDNILVNAGITQFTNTAFYPGSGASVNKFDRVLMGGAMHSDAAFPTVAKDWSQSLYLTPINGGDGIASLGESAQVSILTHRDNYASAVALHLAARNVLQTDGLATVYALAITSVGNNTNGALNAPVWGIYEEVTQATPENGAATGIEVEMRTCRDPVYQDPFNAFHQKQVQGIQLGVGSGRSATGQFDATTGIVFFDNPMRWKSGISFTLNSLAAAGPGGSYSAIQFAPLHEIQWFTAANTLGGTVYTDSSGDMFAKASHALKFYTAGLERLSLGYTGNVGVNTSIFGTSAAKNFVLGTGATAPTTAWSSFPSGAHMFVNEATAFASGGTAFTAASVGSHLNIWAKGVAIRSHTAIGDFTSDPAFGDGVDAGIISSYYPSIILNVRGEFAGDMSATGIDSASGFSIAKRQVVSAYLKSTATVGLKVSDELYCGRFFLDDWSGSGVTHLGKLYASTGEVLHHGAARINRVRGLFGAYSAESAGDAGDAKGVFGLISGSSTGSGLVDLADAVDGEFNITCSTRFTQGNAVRGKLVINNPNDSPPGTAPVQITDWRTIRASTPVFTTAATIPLLTGVSIGDHSGLAGVTRAYNIYSFGVNAQNVFEGPGIFGGGPLEADTAPQFGLLQAQSAYGLASTNTNGGDLTLTGGFGKRLFSVLDIGSGNTIVTVTVNGTAITLEGSTSGSGVQFAYGATTTTAATNLAAAINANATLNIKVLAVASGARVYLRRRGSLYSLTIATNQAGRISATGGADGNAVLGLTGIVYVGVSSTLFPAKLTVGVPEGTTDAIMRLEQAQNTNSRGGYWGFGGVKSGSSFNRGFIGFGHTGTGGDTLFTGELADSFCIRAENALHLGTNGVLKATLDTSGQLGLGTTSPTSFIDVRAATAIGLTLDQTNSTNVDWLRFTYSGVTGNYGSFRMMANGVNYIIGPAVSQFAITGGNVGIGGTPAASGALDVQSTTGAFIPPRMTTTQRDAMTVANGMLIYNTTTDALNYRKAGAWVAI